MAVTLAAGDVLTAARFNALAPLYLAQGSDQSLTTSAANWNAGTISLEASSIYIVEYFFDVGNASLAGNDFRPTFVATGGTTAGKQFMFGPATGVTAPAAATESSSASRTYNTTTSFGVPSSTSIRTVLRVVLTLTSTTAGTFIPQVAMSSGTATLYTGSFVIGHRVS